MTRQRPPMAHPIDEPDPSPIELILGGLALFVVLLFVCIAMPVLA